MGKITVWQCDDCTRLFVQEEDYEKHVSMEFDVKYLLDLLNMKNVVLGHGVFVQLTRDQYEQFLCRFEKSVLKHFPDLDIRSPFTQDDYLVSHTLSDNQSPLYRVEHVFSCICTECLRLWDQPYFRCHCTHDGSILDGSRVQVCTEKKS